MPKFSANLGFLWTELSLVDAIHAAKRAGFDAVECHWPFATPSNEINAALEQTGIPMIGLNTAPGDVTKGEFGLCAFPNRVEEAQQAIAQAIAYAAQIGVGSVHVMPGKAFGIDGAMETFLSNLNYATTLAKQYDITILIEPINQRDVPDYYLSNLPMALALIDSCENDNLKIMFDCYHAYEIHCASSTVSENLNNLLTQYIDVIGHIQFASLPDRHEPNEGDVNYAELFQHLDRLGYQGYLGAEYKPRINTEAGLVWLELYN